MSLRQFWCCVITFACALVAQAQQQAIAFKLMDGSVINGRAISGKDTFVQVALAEGGYTNINWAKLSQETLRELESNKSVDKTVAAYAAIFIDPPPSGQREAARKKPISIKEPPRLDRPSSGGLLASPVMLVVFLILYAANIYAAYEISIYRQQPPALVCVVAAIAPVIGPAIFLAMPTRKAPEEPAYEAAAPAPMVEEAPVPLHESAAAPVQAAAPAAPQAVTYTRGQFTFNRRFFETKFAGFLKMVPGEAERDKVIFVKSARGEYTGQRFSKVEPNEVFLQVRKGPATEDVMLPYSEIYEVTIKHKDT